MALKFMDSFAHYSNILEKWDAQDAAGDFQIVPTGRFIQGSLDTNNTSLGTWVEKNISFGDSTFVIGGAHNATDGAPEVEWELRNATGLQCKCRIDYATGVVSIYRGTTLLASSAAAAVTTVTWQYIEFKGFVDNVNGFLEVKVDGTSVVSITTTDTQAQVGNDMTVVRLTVESNASRNCLIDDFYVLDGTGAAPYNDYLGDVKVTVLRPDANGTVNDFTHNGVGANYQQVNEDQMDSDTTFVKGGTVNAREEYELESFADIGVNVGTIFGVQVCNAAKKTDAGTIGYKDNLTVGATIYQSDENTAGAVLYKFSTDPYQVNPDTTNAWLQAEVEAAKPGFTLTTKVI